MTETNPLFKECRQVFSLLPSRRRGEYGKGRETRGDVFIGYIGSTPAMQLWKDRQDPRGDFIALLLNGEPTAMPPGGENCIYVYADPSQHGHQKLTLGGSVAEARHLLAVITRRRDTSGR